MRCLLCKNIFVRNQINLARGEATFPQTFYKRNLQWKSGSSWRSGYQEAQGSELKTLRPEFGGGGSYESAAGAGSCDIFWKECPSSTYVTGSTTNEQLWPCRRHLQQLTCVGTPQNRHFLILFCTRKSAQCTLSLLSVLRWYARLLANTER